MSFKQHISSPRALAILIIFFAYVLSVVIRFENFSQRTGAQGLQATYHVLWTDRALGQSASDSHLFLPTVTKTPQPGNPFKWGSTVESKDGSYVYTSFPPAGFLLPHALLSWQSEGTKFFSLTILNSLIGLLAAFSMGGLARAVTISVRRNTEGGQHTEWTVFAVVSILYLFLRESLVSHGAVYWPQSPAQLPLILGAWGAFRVFNGQRDIPTLLTVFIACLAYPALEWTGFVFGLGVSFAIFLDWFLRHQSRTAGADIDAGSLFAAILALVATTLSGVALIVHFAIAIGLENLLDALAQRAHSRAVGILPALEIIPGYVTSLGALVPVAILATVVLWRKGTFPVQQFRPVYLLLLVVFFPMIENLIMMQHASEFSFDRLKLSVPLFLIVTVFFVQMKRPGKPVYLIAAVYLILSSNLQIFAHDNLSYKTWGQTVAANDRLTDDFRADPQAECVLLGSPSNVRGYLNLTFDSDIVERSSIENLVTIVADDERYCGLALISTRHEFSDLPRITDIALFDRTGQALRAFEASDQH
jgi:hypothetical protein